MLHDVGAEEARTYQMKVCATLLTMGFIQGINPDEMVEFFATQVQAMLLAPPNYKMFGNRPPVWVMRGFYPNSSVFFKLVVARNEKGTWVRVSVPMVKSGAKRTGSAAQITLFSDRLNESINNKMENTFFGADHKLEPLVSQKIKMPRCMSPKGVKIFSYEKPERKKTTQDSK